MRSLDAINKNFGFLVVEVTKQVENLATVIESPGDSLIRKIRASDNYIDVLKSMIENRCFSTVRRLPKFDQQSVHFVQAVTIIAANLERIADFAVNIVSQLQHYSDPAFLKRYDYRPFFSQILGGLERISGALFSRDVTSALEICRIEVTLDGLYKQQFDRVFAELRTGRETDALVTTMFIFHYLERMGDSLLNIGEAVLFAVMGEKLKIHQYRALHESIENAGVTSQGGAVGFESIWGTRSGMRIGRVHDKEADENGRELLFKEGDAGKLASEKRNIERWQSLLPGLTPKVLEFSKDSEDATLLLEYLNGSTFQEVLLNSDPAVIGDAFEGITHALGQVWTRTRNVRAVFTDYAGQLAKRIGDVLKIHPEFRLPARQIGDLCIAPLEDTLARAAEINRELHAPFSVLIHGDLNVDNIIYDPLRRSVHFIDLHRSEDSDYVQDVAVLLVSHFRLPIFDRRLRARLDDVMHRFLGFSQRFAQANGDGTHAARLALAMTRSFMTSTRFEFDERFAKDMHLRSVFLLERLFAHQGRPWEDFHLPAEVLVY